MFKEQLQQALRRMARGRGFAVLCLELDRFKAVGAGADLVMKQADLALSRGKASGRDGFAFYQPEMNDVVESRRSLESDLRRALDHDALEVGYQPIVVLESGRIAGFEALPRWTHPSRGVLAG